MLLIAGGVFGLLHDLVIIKEDRHIDSYMSQIILSIKLSNKNCLRLFIIKLKMIKRSWVKDKQIRY